VKLTSLSYTKLYYKPRSTTSYASNTPPGLHLFLSLPAEDSADILAEATTRPRAGAGPSGTSSGTGNFYWSSRLRHRRAEGRKQSLVELSRRTGIPLWRPRPPQRESADAVAQTASFLLTNKTRADQRTA
jgi:hypothetical protein